MRAGTTEESKTELEEKTQVKNEAVTTKTTENETEKEATAVPSAVISVHGKEELKTDKESIISTKITDVNIACIEHILKYLNLSDLLNASDSNKHLKDAAELVFAVKFSGKTAIIHELLPSLNQVLQVQWNSINVEGLKPCLQLLRCFGHLISELMIIHGSYFQNAQHIDRFSLNLRRVISYVKEYCVGSLTGIRIKGCPSRAFELLPMHQKSVIDHKFTNWYSDMNYYGYERKIRFRSMQRDFPHVEQQLKSIRSLLSRTEYNYNICSLTVDEVVQLLIELKELKQLRFTFDCRFKFDTLVERLSNRWEAFTSVEWDRIMTSIYGKNCQNQCCDDSCYVTLRRTSITNGNGN